MPVSLASNTASRSAQLRLQRSSSELSKVFQRLSSGLRINSASDDPAGVMPADSPRADALIANTAVRNAGDGISMAAIIDSSLSEISTILSRMSELAEQSANGAYANPQRSALSMEFQALGSELERIAVSTEFNGLNLLSGASQVTLQIGLDGTENFKVSDRKEE